MIRIVSGKNGPSTASGLSKMARVVSSPSRISPSRATSSPLINSSINNSALSPTIDRALATAGSRFAGVVHPDDPLTRGAVDWLDHERVADHCGGLEAAIVGGYPGESGLGDFTRPKQLPLSTLVSCGGGSRRIVGPETEFLAGDGCGDHPAVVGGHHAIDWSAVADADYRFRGHVWVRAVDLQISVAHVEWRRIFRSHDEVDTEPFGSADEICGPVGGAGE